MASIPGRGRRKELAQHVVDRRRREDDSRRLLGDVPTLASLALSIEEHGTRHVRRIVVEQAAAHFELGCSSGSCEGAHDVTTLVMHGLRMGARQIEGEMPCDHCACVLRFTADAEYHAGSPNPSFADPPKKG